jgi:PAS domain S-box-containing protein
VEPAVLSPSCRHARARRDLAGLLVLLVGAFLISSYLELFERLSRWIRTHEPVPEVGEVLVVGLVGVLAAAVYAWRRFRETVAMERLLAARTERYRSLFEYNPVAVFSLDSEGHFTAANPAAQALTGYSESEMLHQCYFDVVVTDERTTSAQNVAQVLSGRHITLERTVLRKDGSHLEVHITAMPIIVNGQVEGVFGLAQDVGQRLRAIRELERANEMKSLFVANVSHEIRTPLTSVLAAIELLGETDLDADQHHLVAAATRSGERLLRLVDNLLDFSQLETSRLGVASGLFDPHVIVDATSAWAEVAAAAKGLTYTSEVDVPPGTDMQGDRARVTQVLDSLVENALKFTESGWVHVRVKRSDGKGSGGTPTPRWVEFAVSDTGVGLTADDQTRVFESFTQVDGRINRAHEGAGLGLTICRELVTLMGGSIWVESSPGTGSTFAFRVPQPEPSDGTHRAPSIGLNRSKASTTTA